MTGEITDTVMTFWLIITEPEKKCRNETSDFHDKIYNVHLETWLGEFSFHADFNLDWNRD